MRLAWRAYMRVGVSDLKLQSRNLILYITVKIITLPTKISLDAHRNFVMFTIVLMTANVRSHTEISSREEGHRTSFVTLRFPEEARFVQPIN